MSIGPDGERFPWGRITQVHEIGDYVIVEYISNDNAGTFFSAYVNGRSTGHRHPTLDHALAWLIAHKHDGLNSRADTYFMRMIGAVPD